MNLPNRLTLMRFFISIIYFVAIAFVYYNGEFRGYLLDVGLGLFIVAFSTDILDGYLARRYQMVTDFGRIADPFIDKVITCGSWIFFVSWIEMRSFLPAWIVVVIITREFIVSVIRTYAEIHHIPFGSSSFGQHKTTIQSLTIIWILFYLGHLSQDQSLWAMVVLKASIWLTLLSTVFSGISYLFIYRRLSNTKQ